MSLRNDPFQRLDLCGVFQRAMEVFMAEPITFLSIGLIGVLPDIFMNWLFFAKFAVLFSFDDESDPEEVNRKIIDTAMGLIGPLLISLSLFVVASIVLKVATVRATIQVYIQKQPMLSQDLKHGLKLLPRILCLHCALLCGSTAVAFVTGLFIGILSAFTEATIGETAGALIMLIFNLSFQVAVMYYSYTIIFWDTALVVEDLSEFQPFLRSYDLVKGQCCFVFRVVVVEFSVMVPLFGLNYILFGDLGSYAVAIAQALTGVVLSPYAGIVLTVLYVNARVKRGEECNGAVLAQEMMVDGEISGSYNAIRVGILSDNATCADEVEIMETTKDSGLMA